MTSYADKVVGAMTVLDEVLAEILRQDKVHPSGYPATRDGVRLGLAAAEDELEEAKQAWREGRCKCPEPMCEHADWANTREEIIQTAAVLLRTASSMPQSPAK